MDEVHAKFNEYSDAVLKQSRCAQEKTLAERRKKVHISNTQRPNSSHGPISHLSFKDISQLQDTNPFQRPRALTCYPLKDEEQMARMEFLEFVSSRQVTAHSQSQESPRADCRPVPDDMGSRPAADTNFADLRGIRLALSSTDDTPTLNTVQSSAVFHGVPQESVKGGISNQEEERLGFDSHLDVLIGLRAQHRTNLDRVETDINDLKNKVS